MATKGLHKNRWHVNPESGDVGLCNATIKTCPYGGQSGTENHYATRDAAQEAVEKAFEVKFGGNLPENIVKTLKANKSKMVFDAQPEANAANFTDELVTKGFPARLAGSSVRVDFISKNPEKPGDELGDLAANIRYIDSGPNEGKWLFSTHSPKNQWYGSARALYGSGNRILIAREVLAELRRIKRNPKAEVERIQALSKDGF